MRRRPDPGRQNGPRPERSLRIAAQYQYRHIRNSAAGSAHVWGRPNLVPRGEALTWSNEIDQIYRDVNVLKSRLEGGGEGGFAGAAFLGQKAIVQLALVQLPRASRVPPGMIHGLGSSYDAAPPGSVDRCGNADQMLRNARRRHPPRLAAKSLWPTARIPIMSSSGAGCHGLGEPVLRRAVLDFRDARAVHRGPLAGPLSNGLTAPFRARFENGATNAAPSVNVSRNT